MDKPVDIPSPPTAEQRPYSYERHGVTIEDPWHWLRDPKYPDVDDPDVLAYLKAENAYFEGWKAQHQGLLDQLFEEMKGRIKEDDSSVPIRDGDWLYWWAFKPAARNTGPGTASRSAAATTRSSSTSRWKPRGANISGSARSRPARTASCWRRWPTMTGRSGSSLRIRDLATGKDVETVTKVGIGQPVWTSDSAGIVFTEVNDNWRSYRARYHRLGAPTGRGGDALRGDGGAGLLRRRRQVARPEPDHRLDRRQCDERGAVRVGGRSVAAADADFARASPTANIMSTRRTGNCGSTPTTTM